MKSEYAIALGDRLRDVRKQQRLSLHAVEEKSQGRWPAVTIGSWERADRSVTVEKLAELAVFYGVPITALLPEDRTPVPPRVVELVAQLREELAGFIRENGGVA